MAEARDAGSLPQVGLVVNGSLRQVSSSASLLLALRDDLGLTGAKPGCGEGACGACTVLVDGDPVRACQQSAGSVAGRQITTIEGLATDGLLHPVQQAFADVGAAQCGYCTPGMILSAVALLARDPDPDDDAITAALTGNLCRCGCYPRIRRATRRAAELVQRSAGGPDGGLAGAQRLPQTADRWGPPEPGSPWYRPPRPWDLTEPADRGWFDVLGDGLVVVAGQPPGTLATPTSSGGAWLHVSADTVVTAFTGKVDMGQDNRTALRLLVAEELGLAVTRVRLAMGDTDLCPYDLGTFGSRSMPDAGSALRRAAAYARALLPVPAAARRVEIVEGEPILRPAAQWQTAGRSHLPPGTRDAVTGGRRFGSDLSVPGMGHGAVLQPPARGATMRTLDTSAVDRRDDVLLVRTEALTGVVAPDRATARLALSELQAGAEWDLPAAPSDRTISEFLRAHPVEPAGGRGRAFHHESGDADAALRSADASCQSTYTAAYIAPAPLETRAAVAVWDDDGRLTVWTGTQTPFPVRAQVAAALGIDERQVRVIVPPTGGGFGGKHTAGVAIEAAILARCAGRPVRVAWNRHEEFTSGTLRPAAVIDVASGATTGGDLTAWTHRNVNSGPAAIGIPYQVRHLRLDYQPAASPLPQASYRALAATANNFARESQIDELAQLVGLDPVEFRLRNRADERLAAVLGAAAERVGWASRDRGASAARTGGAEVGSEPNAGRVARVGWGVACGAEKDGRVATAAEVRVEPGGRLRVIRLVTAYECGAVVNPETVISQIEGAAVMALGGALFESIRFDAGVITNGAFSSYRVPRMDDVPPIEVIVLDRPDLPSAGAGETPMIAIAPAIANAIFAATGQRRRSLPLTQDGLLR